MKSTQSLIAILLCILVVSCTQKKEAEEKPMLEKGETTEQQLSTAEVNDGVFIHIMSGPEDVHKVLMALQMAALMSESKDVAVYFDIKGVEVVLKDSQDLMYSHFPSSHTQLKKLIDAGVTVMACPGCLKAADKTAEDLMEGVQLADKDVFFNFTRGRIFTIDY